MKKDVPSDLNHCGFSKNRRLEVTYRPYHQNGKISEVGTTLAVSDN
jgi:hypothetical protein